MVGGVSFSGGFVRLLPLALSRPTASKPTQPNSTTLAAMRAVPAWLRRPLESVTHMVPDVVITAGWLAASLVHFIAVGDGSGENRVVRLLSEEYRPRPT